MIFTLQTFGLPLLKDKYHKERFKIKTELEKDFEALKSSWWIIFPSLSWIETLDVRLKEQNDFMKFCKLSDQWSKAKTDFVNEKKSVDELMTQKARVTRVKASLQKLQENRDGLEKVLQEQRTLVQKSQLAFLETRKKHPQRNRINFAENNCELYHLF